MGLDVTLGLRDVGQLKEGGGVGNESIKTPCFNTAILRYHVTAMIDLSSINTCMLPLYSLASRARHVAFLCLLCKDQIAPSSPGVSPPCSFVGLWLYKCTMSGKLDKAY